ncbi:MAG TPA: class I SAM-dependent methyltransferase [Dehalococcoidia bacterium]|jgi:ubiquinone/menaquinone biosynthesis C-methylase UbiE
MLTIDFDLIELKDGERVLDVGCGEGRHTWEACKRNSCSVYALDIEEDNLKKVHYALHLMEQKKEVRGKWLLTRGNITSLPFADGSFDRVICSEVLEHIPDDHQAIGELVRVLKDDGILAVSVPSYLPESICWKLSKDYHGKPGSHIRIYKTGELISKLKKHNLRPYATRYKHALHSFYWIARSFFGVENEKARIPALYYRFLVWDIQKKSKPVRIIDDFLNKFFSKSLVVYSRKIQAG